MDNEWPEISNKQFLENKRRILLLFKRINKDDELELKNFVITSKFEIVYKSLEIYNEPFLLAFCLNF